MGDPVLQPVNPAPQGASCLNLQLFSSLTMALHCPGNSEDTFRPGAIGQSNGYGCTWCYQEFDQKQRCLCCLFGASGGLGEAVPCQPYPLRVAKGALGTGVPLGASGLLWGAGAFQGRGAARRAASHVVLSGRWSWLGKAGSRAGSIPLLIVCWRDKGSSALWEMWMFWDVVSSQLRQTTSGL